MSKLWRGWVWRGAVERGGSMNHPRFPMLLLGTVAVLLGFLYLRFCVRFGLKQILKIKD